MELTAYLRILRQRWRLLLAPVIAALAIAAVTLPQAQSQPTAIPAAESYSATTTLINEPPPTTATVLPTGLAQVALYATLGEIPERAARILDFKGEPQLLATMVTVTPQDATGTLTITTSDPNAKAAAARANAFAKATIEFFRDRQSESDNARIEVLEKQLSRTRTQLEEAQARSGAGGGAVASAEVSSLSSQFSGIYSELSQLNRNAGTWNRISVIQPAVPIPQGGGSTTVVAAPENPYLRVGLAALLGLLLGGALALVVERLDSRMRTREQVEDAIGLPVLAEVPLMGKGQREGIASSERPASSVAEAFRGLRSSVLLLSPGAPRAKDSTGPRSSVVVMVTSALPGAGKTTTAANLAAVMAEAGRRVLVLSLDLRNPTIHHLFGNANLTGVSELLSADRGRHLEQVVHETGLAGVSIATSGHDTDHPGALLASVGPLVEAARELADVVIIDAPPVLTVSDALDLARHADVTLLVSRLNKTTRAQASECQRLFKRLGVSALGTVLVGSKAAGVRYGYSVNAHADLAEEADNGSSDTAVMAKKER